MKKNWVLAVMLFMCVQLQAQTNMITTIAGQDTAGYCGDGGLAINAALDRDNQLCLDHQGNLLIADAINHRIRKINLSTGIITTVAGTGTPGYNGDNIPATNAELFVPSAVAVDSSGNIFIGDDLNYRVRKVTASTGIINTIAGNGVNGFSGNNGPATDARIGAIAGMSFDKHGNLYFADIFNSVVWKLTPDGMISVIAGNGTTGYTGDGGPATDATFNEPGDAWVDSSGNIIIGDVYNNVLRKIDAGTGIVTTIAGNGTAGHTGDGGLAIDAKLNVPYGLFIDKGNNIFFAEPYNGTVRRIDGATGIITTVAGNGTEGYAGDGGPATDAELKPDDVYLDSNGTMYMADYNPNNRIRKVYNPKLATPPIAIGMEGAVTVYPNPATNELTIAHAKGCEVSICDVVGARFGKLTVTNDKQTIDISNLSPGVYVVAAVDVDGMRQTFKLIKE